MKFPNKADGAKHLPSALSRMMSSHRNLRSLRLLATERLYPRTCGLTKKEPCVGLKYFRKVISPGFVYIYLENECTLHPVIVLGLDSISKYAQSPYRSFGFFSSAQKLSSLSSTVKLNRASRMIQLFSKLSFLTPYHDLNSISSLSQINCDLNISGQAVHSSIQRNQSYAG